MVLRSLHRLSPQALRFLCVEFGLNSRLCLLIQGMFTIAPSSFPGLPIFLPRCKILHANFGVRVYVSIDGQWVSNHLNSTKNPCKAVLEARGFSSPLRSAHFSDERSTLNFQLKIQRGSKKISPPQLKTYSGPEMPCLRIIKK